MASPSLQRRSTRRRRWRRAALAVTASLLIHGGALRAVQRGSSAATSTAPRAVTLTPVAAAPWAANRRIDGSAASLAAARPRDAEPVAVPPPPPAGQVVDVAPSANPTPPRESRFLAEHDSSVTRETRSRHARPDHGRTLPAPAEATPAPTPTGPLAATPGEGGRDAARRAAPEPARDPARAVPPAAAPVAPAPPRTAPRLALREGSGPDLRPRVGERRAILPGGPPERGGAAPGATSAVPPPGGGPDHAREGTPGPLDARLRPAAADYERVAGGPAPDRLDGVEEGEGTFLNTRGWKYASYFTRISQAVRGHWDPNRAVRAREAREVRSATRDRTTLLVVKLDDRGGLKDVVVERSCGLDFLDRAAVEALERAQPFDNPPRGLADARGEIVFSYGFTLQGSLGLEGVFRRSE